MALTLARMDDARRAQRLALGREIRALMGRNVVSQTRLGDYIGCGQSGLSRRLRGETPFDWDEINAVAEFFDVPLAKLLPETAYPGSEPTPGLLSSALV